MVHLPHLGKLRRAVKETAAAEEESGGEGSPFYKRFRLAQPPVQQQQEWGTGGSTVVHAQPSQYDLLDAPSPLGLRLKKSPSLVDLIQMKLTQAGKTKDTRSAGNPSASEKLKASNFPASLLRIGAWERISRYEGDLVAKCYFAKHKLVWEVLDGGLKSKIEIQWSDISALKATCPENEPGTLEIVLSRQPLFFRETNPQPRKHTLWQATSDFTGGQASMHRRHFLQCPMGLMNKHIEKLIRCDPRLYSLSQQTDINLENPYFEPRFSVFEDPEDSKCRGFDHMDDDCQLQSQRFQELSSTYSSLSRRTNTEAREYNVTSDAVSRHFPTSVLDTPVIKEDASGEGELHRDIFDWNGFKVPGLRHSMSKSEIMNHIGHHIYKKINSGNQPGNGDGSSNKETLNELTGYLLNDSQVTDAADEKILMSRVNSLCSLLQRDSAPAQSLQVNTANVAPDEGGSNIDMYERKPVLSVVPIEGDGNDRSFSAQPGSMPRQDMGELLMHLPRISSFPHFL